MSDYMFSTEIPVRFRDEDAVGHVNNAVYATYLEQARVECLDALFDDAFQGRGLVLAHLEVDFRREVTAADGAVTVDVAVTDVGGSSFEMSYRVTAGGDVAATGRTVQVAYDGEADEPRRIPDDWREVLTAEATDP